MAGLSEASADPSSDFRMDYGSRDEQNGVWEPSWVKRNQRALNHRREEEVSSRDWLSRWLPLPHGRGACRFSAPGAQSEGHRGHWAKSCERKQNPEPLLVPEATPALLRSRSGGGVLKNLGRLKVTLRPVQEALSTVSKAPSQPGAAPPTTPHPTPPHPPHPSLLPQILQETMKGMSLTECPRSVSKLPLLSKQGSLFKRGLRILLLKVHDESKA